ncbi:unnamed protein product [Schistosoma turkestanicum]|nr:unnamed protein product [Schistosoma turkestanicum]
MCLEKTMKQTLELQVYMHTQLSKSMKKFHFQNYYSIYSICRVICCLLLGFTTGLLILLIWKVFFGTMSNYQQLYEYHTNRKNYLSDILTEFIVKNIVSSSSSSSSSFGITTNNNNNNNNNNNDKLDTNAPTMNDYYSTSINEQNKQETRIPPITIINSFDVNKTNSHTKLHINVDTDYSTKLYKKVRILCYINTHPENYYKKAIHVHNTWARRCTKHLFMSTKPDPILPIAVLKLPYPESKMHLWSKFRIILRYIYQFRNDYDYFLKTDDDTYVIIENLLHVLQNYSPDKPFMIGHRFPIIVRNGYFSGGAGYVLSREALKRIVEQSIDKHPKCPVYDENMEDVKMSICGQAVGVRLYDVFDILGRFRLLWTSPDLLLNFTSYRKLKWRPVKLQPNSLYAAPHQSLLSDGGISFHYITPDMMYMLEYFLYYIRPIGLVNDFIQLPDEICNQQ